MSRPEMRYTTLGKSKTEVSSLCFGMYTILQKTGPLEAFKLVGKAWDYGVNFFDTSDNYKTEIIVGRSLRENKIPREKAVIATKTGLPMNEYHGRFLGEVLRTDRDTSAARIKMQAENSIKIMETGYIDLYQTHVHDEHAPASEVVLAMNELVEEGKIRHYGFSNYSRENVAEALQACKEQKLKHHPVSLQPYYNIAATGEDALVDYAKGEGLTVMAHRPLASGYLVDSTFTKVTGLRALDDNIRNALRKNPGADNPESMKEVNEMRRQEAAKEEIKMLQIAATGYGRNIQQLSTAWLLHRGVVPIMGANTEKHLDEYVSALGWQLDERILGEVDAVRKNLAKIKDMPDFSA